MNDWQKYVIFVCIVALGITILYPADIWGRVYFITQYHHFSDLDRNRLFLLIIGELLITAALVLVLANGQCALTWIQRIILSGLIVVLLWDIYFSPTENGIGANTIFDSGIHIDLTLSVGIICTQIVPAALLCWAFKRHLRLKYRLIIIMGLGLLIVWFNWFMVTHRAR